MKKLIAIFVCLALLCAGVMAVSAAGDTYVVAGSDGLCNGETWAATSDVNTMTENADGTYSLTVKNVQPGNYEFKIVKNGSEWLGDPDNWSQNYSLTIKTACDVTITYNPTTGYAKATGTGVTAAVAPAISVMSIRGEGLPTLNWDNGIPMELVSDGIYEYTFEDLTDANLFIKFAANGNWNDYNFGGAFTNSGEATGAVWSGENIAISVSGTYDVIVRLDLRNLDYSTKQGATFTITFEKAAVEETQPTPTEPAPTEPAPTEPAPTTPAPTEPAPTEPASTEPAPTVPAATESAPTHPTDIEPAPQPTQPQQGQPGDDDGGFPIALIVVIIGVVLVVGILVARKARKKA